jgi:DNA invertase Pin-like site-specific DNA recombinase
MGRPLREDNVTVSPESLVNLKSGAGSPSTTGKKASKPRAVGIVRVSHVGGRTGEFSPEDQEKRIRDECKREGFRVVDVIRELDVSGGTPLERRHGLRGAVELVEDGRAEVIVCAYFDRLVRSLDVQLEVVKRVEQAGGKIIAVDVGHVTNGTAALRLSSNMIGAVAEYHRGVTAERTVDAKVRAVASGVAPFPNIPPGYRRGEGEDKRTELDPETFPIVAEGFRLRAKGATIREVRGYLRAHGIALSYHGVQAMLCNRFFLGELHFGSLANLEAHPALIDAATWIRAQHQHVPRGRRPKSERLLARLGVLRCATCGARMVIGSTDQRGKRYWMYRCPPISDCPQRVTISSDLAEQAVEDEVRRLLQGMKGRASPTSGVEEAARRLEQAENELASAIRAFTGAGVDGEATAQEQLRDLREARDSAVQQLEDLSRTAVSDFVLDGSTDWNLLTLSERRSLIRAAIAKALVAPGRGIDRITFEPLPLG